MPNRYQVLFLLAFTTGLGGLFVASHLIQKALAQSGFSPVDLLLTGLPRNKSTEDTSPSAILDPISVLINMANESGFDLSAFVAQNQTAIAGAVGAIVLTALYFVFGGQKPKGKAIKYAPLLLPNNPSQAVHQCSTRLCGKSSLSLRRSLSHLTRLCKHTSLPSLTGTHRYAQVPVWAPPS
jgi:hypothetical protein